MTDAEIMKALECCVRLDYNDFTICKAECPWKGNCYDEEKGIHFLKDVLDLINRQKEMIDGLIAGQETLQKCIAEKTAEIERLQQNLEEAHIDIREHMAEIEKYENIKATMTERKDEGK